MKKLTTEQVLARIAKGVEDEARDEKGQWTSGGSSNLERLVAAGRASLAADKKPDPGGEPKSRFNSGYHDGYDNARGRMDVKPSSDKHYEEGYARGREHQKAGAERDSAAAWKDSKGDKAKVKAQREAGRQAYEDSQRQQRF